MRLKYIIDKKYDKSFVKDEKIKKNFDDLYNKNLKYLKEAQRLYQKSWNKINKEFSDYIEKETGYKWFYPVYYCIISVIHRGISNWGTDSRIIRWWKANPYSQRRITAHELIISHYFEIYKHNYKKYKLTDNQVWALAEIAAFALTGLTEKSKQFWPWDYSGYYTNHNYPQIVELQNKLKEPFLKRKNFDAYIKNGIELIKKYPKNKYLPGTLKMVLNN